MKMLLLLWKLMRFEDSRRGFRCTIRVVNTFDRSFSNTPLLDKTKASLCVKWRVLENVLSAGLVCCSRESVRDWLFAKQESFFPCGKMPLRISMNRSFISPKGSVLREPSTECCTKQASTHNLGLCVGKNLAILYL